MAKKMQVTSAIHNSPYCSPLYLPQLYWLILRNAGSYSTIPTHIDIRQRWEEEYLALCLAFGIKAKDGQEGPFWTKNCSNLISKIDSTKTLETLIQKDQSLSNLFQITGRIDQRIKMPCSAIGLIAYEETKLKDDEPSPFFFSIINDDGCIAALRIISRLLSISYPSVEYLKVTPSELLQKTYSKEIARDQLIKPLEKDYKNQSTGTYSMSAYTHALFPWFEGNMPSETDTIPKGIVDIIDRFPPKKEENWRDSNPDEALLAALANLGIQLLSINKEIHQSLKEEIMAKLTKFADPINGIRPHNIILVGPPGTGKSRIAKKIAKEILSGREISSTFVKDQTRKPIQNHISNPNLFNVQFHPSYGYEDFVEGLRPVANLEKNSTIRYSIVPGPFKIAAQLARSYSDKSYSIPLVVFIDPISHKLCIPKEFDLYRLHARKGSFTLKDAGTAISITVESQDQDLTVSDWPTGYQEVLWKPTETELQQFVIIIDELNRGNPASIFGELLSLIENSKRIGQGEEMELILPVSKEPFRLPNNIHIIATMNLADRSLAMLDQAFRRRFKFLYMKPDFSLIRDLTIFREITDIEPKQEINVLVANHFAAINYALEHSGASQECLIGHSYAFSLLNLVYKENISIEDAVKRIWDTELHSLVREIIGENIIEFVKKFEEKSKELKNGLISNSIKDYLQDVSVPDIEWEKAA